MRPPLLEVTGIWLLFRSFWSISQLTDEDEGFRRKRLFLILSVSLHFSTGRSLQIMEEEDDNKGQQAIRRYQEDLGSSC